jgi:hypothetical protein
MDLKGARVALEKSGYSEDDFELVRSQEGSQGGQPVYVIYKPTGFRRMYEEADWPTGFEEDLKNQIFKPGP